MASWVPGQVGNAIEVGGPFSGVINCGNDSPLDRIGKSDFSISFKVNFSTDDDPLEHYYFYKGPSLVNPMPDPLSYIMIALVSNVMVIDYVVENVEITFDAFDYVFATNTDYHIVIAFSKTLQKISMYVNKGKDTHEIDWLDGTDISNTEDVQLGGGAVGKYVLDQFRIYDKALNFTEDYSLYTEGLLDENSFKSFEAYCNEYPEDSEGAPMRPPGPSARTVKASSEHGQVAYIANPIWFDPLGFFNLKNDAVTWTSDALGEYSPHYTFDINKDLLGTWTYNQWLTRGRPFTLNNIFTNLFGVEAEDLGERVNFDLGIAVIPKKLVLINSHSKCLHTNSGIKDFLIQGTNDYDVFAAGYTYGGAVAGWSFNAAGWTTLGQYQAVIFDPDSMEQSFYTKHVTTAYRYYSIKVMSNHGNAEYTGIRDAVLWGAHPRYAFDHVVDSKINKPDFKRTLFKAGFCHVIQSQGKLKMVWEGSQEADGAGGLQDKVVVHGFDTNNIMKGSFSRKRYPRYNKIKINYINSHENYKKDFILDVDGYDLQDRGERLFESTCYFIYYQDIARRRARRLLKKAMYCDWEVTLSGKDDSSHVELYDLVTVTHPRYGWDQKQFIVVKKSSDWLGRSEFALQAYYSGIYDDEECPVPESFFSRLSMPFVEPGALDSLAVTDTSYWDKSGNYSIRSRVTYELPNGLNFFDHVNHEYGLKISGEGSLTTKSGESETIYFPADDYALIKDGSLIYSSGEYRTIVRKTGLVGSNWEAMVGQTINLSGQAYEYVNFDNYSGHDKTLGSFEMTGDLTEATVNDTLFIRSVAVNQQGIFRSPPLRSIASQTYLLGWQQVYETLTSGEKRWLPINTYITDSTNNTLPDAAINIEGVSEEGVIFQNTPGEDGLYSNNPTKEINISNFTVQSQNISAYSYMINILGDSIPECTANVRLSNFTMDLVDDEASAGDIGVIMRKGTGSLLVTNAKTTSGEYGVYAMDINKMTLYNPVIDHARAYGIYFHGIKECVIDAPSMNGGQQFGIYGRPDSDNVVKITRPTIITSGEANAAWTGITIDTVSGRAEDCVVSDPTIMLETSSSTQSKGIHIGSMKQAKVTGATIVLKVSVDRYAEGIKIDDVTDSIISQNNIYMDILPGSWAHRGVFLTGTYGSDRNILDGNSIDMVNDHANDTAIILSAGSNDNSGAGNITYNAGTSVDDLGASNEVTAKDI